MAEARKIQMYDPNSKTHKDKVRKEILRKIFVCVVLVVVLLPFYVAIMYAFKPANEITANRLAFSSNPTIHNFKRVIFENQLFRIGFKNSVINTVTRNRVILSMILLRCC